MTSSLMRDGVMDDAMIDDVRNDNVGVDDAVMAEAVGEGPDDEGGEASDETEMGVDEDLVEIYVAADDFQAQQIADMLVEEGIDAFLFEQGMSMMPTSADTAAVWVRQSDADDARDLIKQFLEASAG